MQTKQIFEKIKSEKGRHEFIPTGLAGLDMALDGGFIKKELVVIGGPTGTGKSYLGIQLAMTAVTNGFRVGYFTLEISNELVVARMIGSRSGIKSSHILYNKYDENDPKFIEAAAHVYGYGALFESYDSIYELEEIEKHMYEQPFDLVVIDFIQNVFSNHSDSYERLSYVALSMQKIAKATNTCTLVLSQLSNEVSKSKTEERPLEYKGSGSIATVADLGFFLSKEDSSLTLPGTENYSLMLAKNRRGPSKMRFDLLVKWPGGTFYEQTPITKAQTK